MLRPHLALAGGLGFLLAAFGVSLKGQAAPLLYVYRGAGCTGVAALPQVEAMLGRRVDGVVDFNDYTLPPASAVANLKWQLGCWQGAGRSKIAISIGLAFNGLSTADIAAGKGDATFAQMGAVLVAHGFAAADIRLGWESNGGWYAWGRKGATYATAFDRAAKILKATRGSNFTVWYNPAAGMEMNNELPTAEDGMAHDWYANTWNSGGAAREPGLWTGNLTGWWGFNGLGTWPRASLPTAIPELGVGSRSDGHGACMGTDATACDDPSFLISALAQATKVGVRFVGYWDYDAGDYNSQVSSGERPGEAAVLIQTYGGVNTRAILANRARPHATRPAPALTCTDPAGAVACHAVSIQTAPSHWDIVAWAGSAHRSAKLSWSGKTLNANLYKPAGGTGVARALGPASSVTVAFKGGDQIIVGIQQ